LPSSRRISLTVVFGRIRRRLSSNDWMNTAPRGYEIGLDEIGAHLRRQPVRRERMLGAMTARTPMSDDQRRVNSARGITAPVVSRAVPMTVAVSN